MIIDTHAHTLDAKFDSDRNKVLQRAKDAGVDMIFEIACEVGEWPAALEFSKRDNIYAAYGIHPLEVENYKPEDLTVLETYLKDDKCIAIGEIGLDYHYDSGARKEEQKALFIKQLAIAKKLNKLVILHCRDAYEDMFEIIKNYSFKGVLHCFLGNRTQAKMFTDLGFLIGITCPVTYPKSDELRKVVSETDISKILIETDCPYLPPQTKRGQRNEPAYVVEALKAVAEIKELPYEEAAKITRKNAVDLFLKQRNT